MKIIWNFHNTTAVYVGTIDGTHCPIEEPQQKHDTIWYSHKFNCPGLTYQIVMSVYESKFLSVWSLSRRSTGYYGILTT
jgi:hypothetical protein